MPARLPSLYFRIRDTGASVFRIDTEHRHQRLEMEHLANINMAKGDYRTQGERTATPEEDAAIRDWIATRRQTLDMRARDDVMRLIDALNLTTQWAHGRATDADLDLVTDPLLMAMHDLRATLVRKMADRLDPGED
ncbi:hypothetical protein [Falsirhodobacter halotolerans]|uniref:hypothetical protein n=1 Tax=Falsirhodobacter halotolerans TaxID=1146892 RepID=UPI001FD0C1FB|nr:hypothetical protein [Falsirhodobacter halotolerans]MCJ8139922.1 hypothetical protein [Falsirhodobacter halotolerans]